jgi:hypothetical protein
MAELQDHPTEEGHIRALLKASGAIGYCQRHTEISIDNYDPDAIEEAREAANSEIVSGDFVLPAGDTLSEMIQRVMDGTPDCPECDANAASE